MFNGKQRMYLAAFAAMILIAVILVLFRSDMIPPSIAAHFSPSSASPVPVPVIDKPQTLALKTPTPQLAQNVVVARERAINAKQPPGKTQDSK